MKKVYWAAFLIGTSLVFGFILLFANGAEYLKNFNMSAQQFDKSQIEKQSMDQVLADDLSMTTSMFIKQLSLQLERWGKRDLSSPQLIEKFQEEIKEHAHFESFAIVHNGNVMQSVPKNKITSNKLEKIKFSTENVVFSEPYMEGERQFILMAETLSDDGKTVVGEIDLSFVQQYVKDMAAIADSSGNFFVSGDQPHVKWKSINEIPETVSTQTVPELGWQIVVQSEENVEQENPFKERQAVIKMANDKNVNEWINRQADMTIIEDNNPYYIIQSEGKSTESLLQTLRNDPDIEFAEPNYIYTKQATTTLPNDEFFGPYQWNLTQIDVERGWEFTGGTKEVIIAVLDTGVDSNHQDLKNKVLEGYNAIDDSNDVSDTHGHGTHVAGIAAAITNNVTGIAGVAQNNTILPIKVLNENGEGSSFEVAKGIRWAVDNGASVLNMSLGDYYNSRVLRDAIRYAYNKDAVLIAASGNDNVSDPMYPADYKEVLTVGAVDDQRERAFFSNYGRHIDVAAPGQHIPSTFPNNHYVIMSGTSMAAPHVAGLAGLIRSVNPELSNEDVYTIIRETSVDLGKRGRDPYYGYGEISVSKALQAALSKVN